MIGLWLDVAMMIQWMVLRLAIENEWGGGNPQRKAELMLEELMGLFATAARKNKEVYRDVSDKP